jgi:23S rRNA pseudouridine2605 synthase
MPRKAVKKAKKADPEVTGVAADIPAPREPDEPELKASSTAAPDTERTPHAVAPVSSSGEAEAVAEAADTFEQAIEDLPELPAPVAADTDTPEWKNAQAEGGVEEPEPEPVGEAGGEFIPEERLPAHLERLQKILSQAGIASRRHAEEMITEGRVQVNGKVVTELGTKADPGRDHIRVDGKLIHGAERLRYFVLNKPRGYVTTVSDPEGRPTVMEFFKKAGERLYPVGRLDYQSEGLLLVTNDGDLANKLTRAATGVEKTYLVKVSGQPTADELDRLREGVAIDRTRPGEGRVHTSPAIIREVRSGDNPWYEVVLTEGRNRELRKMFEEIGHHVEKIRRVGYGPLVLDVEPGRFRELEPDELAKLRLAAEGKWRKPKPKEIRHEASRRPPARKAQADRPYRREDQAGGRHEEQGRAGERPERRRPPQSREAWQGERPQRSRPSYSGRTQDFDRSRPKFSDRAQQSERPRQGAWRSEGGKPDRRRQQGEREEVRRPERRPDRRGIPPRYREDRPQEDRPRFEDRARFNRRPGSGEAPRIDQGKRGPGQRSGSRPPRRDAEAPQQRFAPSRQRPARPGFGDRPAFGDREQRPRPAGPRPGTRPQRPAGEFRGEGSRPPRSASPNSGRPNRPSAPRGGKPPFKKASGGSAASRQRSNPRGGPRRRRD